MWSPAIDRQANQEAEDFFGSFGEAPPPQADASRSIVVQQAGGEASESEAEKLKKKAEALKLFAEAKTLMGESTDSISAKIDDLVGDM